MLASLELAIVVSERCSGLEEEGIALGCHKARDRRISARPAIRTSEVRQGSKASGASSVES